jgi:hypothetical protein
MEGSTGCRGGVNLPIPLVPIPEGGPLAKDLLERLDCLERLV